MDTLLAEATAAGILAIYHGLRVVDAAFGFEDKTKVYRIRGCSRGQIAFTYRDSTGELVIENH